MRTALSDGLEERMGSGAPLVLVVPDGARVEGITRADVQEMSDVFRAILDRAGELVLNGRNDI